MMVRIEYEGGRTTLFDTLSFTEGSPFSGANMLTEFELEMREEPEKGLWLTANWHQVRDDWRADAPADGIPAARRSRGWRFMLASEAELGRARRVLLDGDEAFARVRGVPVRRGSDRRLLPRARGPSLKTAEVADKGAAARAGEGRGPGRARRAGEAARGGEGRGRRGGRA